MYLQRLWRARVCWREYRDVCVCKKIEASVEDKRTSGLGKRAEDKKHTCIATQSVI